ncbi:hypothetical protein [Streptomyces gilvus]|uniref:hypothetical protein n=1 Tax=Streptomyces gilvus TaxID=2920937 RepID=UPI0035A893A3
MSEDEPFRYLSVAGGPELYLVTGEGADGEILQLHEPAAGSQSVELVCGGQMGVFPRRDLVTREQVHSAVSDFLNGFPDGLGESWSVDQ